MLCMHVLLFPVLKFLLCANAFVPGKLRVVLKIADQSRRALISYENILMILSGLPAIDSRRAFSISRDYVLLFLTHGVQL